MKEIIAELKKVSKDIESADAFDKAAMLVRDEFVGDDVAKSLATKPSIAPHTSHPPSDEQDAE